MMRRIAVSALFPLLAIGCGDPSEPAGQAATASPSEAKARIDALDAGQRNAVMLRAVRDAGQDCQGVAGSAYQGEQFGMPAWVARCTDGRDWMVMVRADGSALVAGREEKPPA